MAQKFEIVTLKIDGKDIGARGGETILDVAKENNIWIPALCHLEGLTPVGACRLCIVEIKGYRNPLPSCVTKVFEGMEITTHSEKLSNYRRLIMELILSERTHICAVCSVNGFCELQELAQKLGVDNIRFPMLLNRLSVDSSHKRFVRDDNRCILCGRCVRACTEIEGAHTWDFMGRGLNAKLTCDLDEAWAKSQTCTGCGKCTQVCPTGALIEKGIPPSQRRNKRDFLPYLTKMRKGEEDNE